MRKNEAEIPFFQVFSVLGKNSLNYLFKNIHWFPMISRIKVKHLNLSVQGLSPIPPMHINQTSLLKRGNCSCCLLKVCLDFKCSCSFLKCLLLSSTDTAIVYCSGQWFLTLFSFNLIITLWKSNENCGPASHTNIHMKLHIISGTHRSPLKPWNPVKNFSIGPQLQTYYLQEAWYVLPSLSL